MLPTPFTRTSVHLAARQRAVAGMVDRTVPRMKWGTFAGALAAIILGAGACCAQQPGLPARAGHIVAVLERGHWIYVNLPDTSLPPRTRRHPGAAFRETALRTSPASFWRPSNNPAQTSHIQTLLASAAQRYHVSPRLVREVAHLESDFDPNSVSDKGALGVMQLMPETARDLGVSNPFNAAANIDGGVRYLRDLLHQFRGNVPLSLAAYNAGPAAVTHYGGVPPYPETQAYVRVITHRLRRAGWHGQKISSVQVNSQAASRHLARTGRPPLRPRQAAVPRAQLAAAHPIEVSRDPSGHLVLSNLP